MFPRAPIGDKESGRFLKKAAQKLLIKFFEALKSQTHYVFSR
jgi:hypothetical protein